MGRRRALGSKVAQVDLQLLRLRDTPPAEVCLRVGAGAVIHLQQLEEAGHVGSDFCHQAVFDGAHSLIVALQQAFHKLVVIPGWKRHSQGQADTGQEQTTQALPPLVPAAQPPASPPQLQAEISAPCPERPSTECGPF